MTPDEVENRITTIKQEIDQYFSSNDFKKLKPRIKYIYAGISEDIETRRKSHIANGDFKNRNMICDESWVIKGSELPLPYIELEFKKNFKEYKQIIDAVEQHLIDEIGKIFTKEKCANDLKTDGTFGQTGGKGVIIKNFNKKDKYQLYLFYKCK